MLVNDQFYYPGDSYAVPSHADVALLAAPNAEVAIVLRFLTGLGLGPVIPSCVAMTVEFAPKARRQLANAVMYSGYSVGGVLAALLGIMLLPHIDWRWLYAFGADFTVIEPVELRAELVAAAEYHDRVAERYRRAVVAQP